MTTKEHKEYELKNAPYLINPKDPCELLRNYDLLPVNGPVSNQMILDSIYCGTPAEAKDVRGWLWNAFAAGKIVGKETK